MTNILLLSDTHSTLDHRLEKHIKTVDEVWHAGDIGNIDVCDKISAICPNIKVVFGNIDNQEARAEYQKDLFFTTEKVKVWMTHIGGYPPKYNMNIKKTISSRGIKLFICGHSHILKVIYDKQLNCLHMNPGAAGKSGFHKIQTALMFAIEGDEIKNLRIIELDK